MRISFIGSGNVATVMGRSVLAVGHEVTEVFSPDPEHAALLAGMLGARAVSDPAGLDQTADIYIISVPDDALPGLVRQLRLPAGRIVVHTAGSLAAGIVKFPGSNYGVLWPMKMIRRQMGSLRPVTMVVDGNTPETKAILGAFAEGLADRVVYAGDDQRLRMHMVASLVANFPNHLYHLASDYCEAEDLDFTIFHSIIRETTEGVLHGKPADQQAGPAFRGDRQTVERHIGLLNGFPGLKGVYSSLSDSIAAYFGKKLR